MIDTEVASSTSDRLSPGRRDPDPDDLDRLLASLDHIALCCCEPGADKPGECLPLEAVTVHEERLVGAVRTVGEYR